jgi:sec-independent protein translocase protein TatA
MRLGPLEIGLILVIMLVVFGVGKLPQIGGAIGKSMKEFRKAQSEKDEPAAVLQPKEEKGKAQPS